MYLFLDGTDFSPTLIYFYAYECLPTCMYVYVPQRLKAVIIFPWDWRRDDWDPPCGAGNQILNTKSSARASSALSAEPAPSLILLLFIFFCDLISFPPTFSISYIERVFFFFGYTEVRSVLYVFTQTARLTEQ